VLDDRGQKDGGSGSDVADMIRESSRRTFLIDQAFLGDILLFIVLLQVAKACVHHATQARQLPGANEVEFTLRALAATEFRLFVLLISKVLAQLLVGYGNDQVR
jgi:hypothetical protein